VGNSPNINNRQNKGQTGIDTTTTFLVGGRLGIRHQELKAGLSSTYEKDNQLQDLTEALGVPQAVLEEVPIIRLGGDLSYRFKDFYFESEFISVNIDDKIPELALDLDFYYATLGYNITDLLMLYGSYWDMEARTDLLAPGDKIKETENIRVSSVGVSFDLNDSIRLKAHYARVKNDELRRFISQDRVEKERDNFKVYAAAISIIF
jgi:hypothetical protein